ncbi:acetyl-CoA carboxylase biotin carboxylase subunit [bacterium SM23_31]|nr:MAG: acetyl-CoA carboxylase biotin carboxylase subunit [bacterium SM23_31]
MISKLLIANRGEIALRIIRACRELGIKSVAIFSEADRDSLHVRFADEAVCIGPAPSADSYLNPPRIIGAAEICNADAIHPGYGFLAENATFADICKANEIKFIGPTAKVISLMGDKATAKETMKKAGVPVIPGSNGTVSSINEAERIASDIGFPVILKATAGGGGKGMRIATGQKEIKQQFTIARNEAEVNFGNGAIYIEKYFLNARHVEIQILADERGNVIHLGERDCSIQRRHQKLIEESPSPAFTPELRKKMGEAAVRGAQYVDYTNAGTVEFLYTEDGQFYFMEMNTRIQVEHPVTEMVCGLDLVKEQIRVASGESLNIKIKNIDLRGHAIECRINAEDSERDFIPSAGRITSFHLPGGPGIRVDTHAYASYIVPPNYDSLLAKLIVHGNAREEALVRMERALDEFIVEGIHTTIPFHQSVIKTKQFQQGQYHTGLLEELKNGN